MDSEQSFEVDRAALDILDSVLISAESFIRIHKQRERNQMEREAAAGGNIFQELDRQFKETSLNKWFNELNICFFSSVLYKHLGSPM